MHLSGAEVVACGVFFSYFSIIAGLFTFILRSLSRNLGTWEARAYVFIVLALASFAHTWFYMFKFMAWSFANYERTKSVDSAIAAFALKRMSQWLLNTSLFEQAWASVCFGTFNWWWSQQLCLFTVGAWTIFLATEGRRHQVRLIWVYMLFGQLVAISVASNLFYLALVLAPSPPPRPQTTLHGTPASLWLPVLLSLGTIAISPLTDDRTFLPNLLLMHSLILIPLLAPPRQRFSIPLSTLYFLVFVASLFLHTRATSTALSSTPSSSLKEFAYTAWAVLHSHPAQSSIGWDVIWTSISFVAWLVLQPEQQHAAGVPLRLWTAVYLLVATPLVSVGVLAPHVLRPREDGVEGNVGQEKRE